MDSGKVSTCLCIGRDVLETARRLGLNVSRVSENALVEAIGRLQGPKCETGRPNCPDNVVRGVGFEPTNPTGWAP
jgi:hypothetical protein